jgi:acetyl/propionyl-CoA carboxylase alpha subunit
MEMNTRLQVEHPVTEMITGQDLVAWQLHVAAGGPLPTQQSDIHSNGHSVEVRLYAEDPFHDFMPATGRLTTYHFPNSIRVDQGYARGDVMGVYFDPMMAKLIAHGPTRALALSRMNAALVDLKVYGVVTNQPLLLALTLHPDVIAGTFDTHFLGSHMKSLLQVYDTDKLKALAAVMLATVSASPEGGRGDPWGVSDLFQINLPGRCHVDFMLMGHAVAGDLIFEGQEATVHMNGMVISVKTLDLPKGWRCPTSRSVWFVWQGCIVNAKPVVVESALRPGEAYDGHIVAPLPGKVTKLWVQVGQEVREGTPLVTVEAMKMEHTLKAVMPGWVHAVQVTPGQVVSEGETLIRVGERLS